MISQMHFTLVIVGAGSAGISMASRMIRASRKLNGRIAVIDPSTKHYYQPLWTLVGGGAARKEETERDLASLIPGGVTWIRAAVSSFHPDEHAVMTDEGTKISYDYLVVAAGIQIDWHGVKGLPDAIGKDGVCSNYAYKYVDHTWESIRRFRGGTAIFTHPNTPVKCGGAPQKIMYLADDYFRQAGVRDRSQVIFCSANATIFAVKKYADTLEAVIKQKQIETRYRRDLVEIRPQTREAVFAQLDSGQQEVIHYDLLHVTPPMKAPDFIRCSPLADEGGWLDVDKSTLQHKYFENIFGIGDCTNLPTSKTGAAIRKQAPVVEANLLSLMQGRPLVAQYDGYTSCPLVTGYNKLVLAEFDYHQMPQESFPFDQSKERRSMYLLKRDILPIMYWDGMLKGLM